MNDVWFGSDLTHRDLNVISQSLSLLGREPSLIAIGENGTRLVLASRALFKLFGVTDGDDLATRLLSGADAGSQRLIDLSQQLALDGAPRLERLRFRVGNDSEVITFICRRIVDADGQPLLIAAALGIPFEDAPSEPAQARSEGGAAGPARDAPEPAPAPVTGAKVGMTIQEILATLRERWPASRSVRFLWRTDAQLTCTDVTAPLAAIVGQENADLLDRSLSDLASRLDASGHLGALIAGRQTWSGVDIFWPIANAPAAVQIGLGAMALRDHDGSFEGYRGYGVIHLDRVVPHVPTRLQAPAVPRTALNTNVVTFPGGAGPKALTVEDQQVFEEIGEELRDQVGVPPAVPDPTPVAAAPAVLVSEPASTEAVSPSATAVADPDAGDSAAATPSADQGVPSHEAEIARNALNLLNRLSVALLVSRDNIPIFANRSFLEMTGFDDEDDLHAAGGIAHLFGDLPGNNTGAETVRLRARDGGLIAAAARMQRIDWDGLPATLLTLQQAQPVRGCAAPTDAAAAQPASRQGSPEADLAEAEVSVAPRDGELPSADPSGADHDDELRELRAILETATDGVAVIDADCNVVSLNRSGEALFGCDRNAVIGNPFLSLFAPQNQDLASDYFEGLKSNATRSLLNDGREIMIKAYQGGTIPVFMTLGRLGHSGENGAGSPRYCALFRDLTPWKRVERDLESARHDAERASALKSDFLARVNHEIRTPITAIIGFAETMSEERFGPIGSERYKEYLRDIRASGALVVSLVNDLLDLSKIEAGKMELALDPLDLNKIVGECAALMQPQSARERVIMRLSLAGNLPQIKADDRALRQIVLNILSNAVKFNEPGGQVILATAITEAGCVVIRIRDTGPGMSESDLAVALEPFRQLASVRGVGGGTGLGLPLTKALVEANDAVFTIRSKVQQGTLVEVSFPPARVLAGNG